MIKDVTIITGFLGAGKTTLLNDVIAAAQNVRYAVIENEFGEQNIDADLVTTTATDLIAVSDGCLCCSLSGMLIDALASLIRERNNWDELLIECTGIADPANVASPFLLEPGLQDYFNLKTVICVIDAELIEDQLRETQEAIQQISFANTLVINKSAHVSPIYIQTLKEILQNINPFAYVLSDREDGTISIADLMLKERSADFFANPKVLKAPKHVFRLGTGNQRVERPFLTISPQVHRHSDIETILLRFSEPMDLDRLKAQLGIFLFVQSAGVYRIKGIVDIWGNEHKVIIQSVGRRLSITEGKPWEEDQMKETKIVIIGKNLQLKGFKRIFSSCIIKKT